MMNSIHLRDLTEEDLPTLFAHQDDREANLMAAFPPRSKDAFVKHWKENVFSNATATNKAVVHQEQIVGYIGCWQQGDQQLVGYWIGREHWGKGIATQALLEFISAVKHRPLNAFVAKHNVGSIRVLEKCGFKISGEDSFFSELHGQRVDELLMTLG